MNQGAIIITGGASGIGLACATYFSDNGEHVAIVDLPASIENCSASHQDNMHLFACDITDEVTVESTVNAIAEQFDGISGLVNCAGVLADGLLLKKDADGNVKSLSANTFSNVLNVNLFGTFLMTREVAKHMIEREQGVIVNLSSISRAGNKGQTCYSASKAGVDAMTATWGQELSQFGIRVGAIAPGFVDTPMVRKMREDMREKQIQRVPLKRMASTTEIVNAVKFIFDNHYFNGRVLELDGGLRF
ncbi:MAG: SDR family NAD(P)-dependent oxidoreductase [Pseudomonadota bacterium]